MGQNRSIERSREKNLLTNSSTSMEADNQTDNTQEEQKRTREEKSIVS